MKKGISMIDTLRDFIEKINSIELDYMVTGSYAMSAYGEIRMTRDIDIVLQFSEKHSRRFFELFKDDYYVSKEAIRRALDRKSMFNVVSLTHGGKIDCIIQKDTDFAKTSFTRRYREMVAGVEFWTTTREDLIIAKLDWASESRSEMQIRDIANLTMHEYDSNYVNTWIEKLGLTGIWDEVRRWKTQHTKPKE